VFQSPIGVKSGCHALVEVEDAAESMMSSDRATVVYGALGSAIDSFVARGR
jgi:hypothetical protein